MLLTVDYSYNLMHIINDFDHSFIGHIVLSTCNDQISQR